MKIKDDILEKWESGKYTIYDLAKDYITTPEAVVSLLGLQRIDSDGIVTIDDKGEMEIHLNEL